LAGRTVLAAEKAAKDLSGSKLSPKYLGQVLVFFKYKPVQEAPERQEVEWGTKYPFLPGFHV
jgi:hypothetical protein